MGVWSPGANPTAGNDTFTGDGTNENANGQLGDDTLIGNGGHDTLIGHGGADNLSGGDGDDFLYGGTSQASNVAPGVVDGADYIDGGEGNDVLRGQDGDDTLIGGNGVDNLRGDLGNDTLNGGDGEDMVSYRFDDIGLTSGVTFSVAGYTNGGVVSDGRGGFDTLISIERILLSGTVFNDTLTGSFGRDQITTNGGNDIIYGGGGHDHIIDHAGNSSLYGETGEDFFTMYATASPSTGFQGGTDFIDGGDGTDGIYLSWSAALTGITVTLTGTTLDARTNDNSIVVTGVNIEEINVDGSVGADVLTGGDGDDGLWGLDNNDILTGNGGRDNLWGGYGDDTLNGGDGNDYYNATDYIANPFDVRNLNFSTFNVSGATYQLTDIYGGTDTLSSIEGVFALGSVGDDTIVGSAGHDRFDGGYGTDTIDGGDGNDWIVGTHTLVGGFYTHPVNGQTFVTDGNDSFTGGSGIDVLSYEFTQHNLVFNMALGTVTSLATGTDTFTGFEHYIGGFANDEFNGAAAAEIFYGSLGNDIAAGGAGNDTLDGGEGEDILEGGADNDTLRGGSGLDEVYGGDGDDVIELYWYELVPGDIVDGGAGTDRIVAYGDADLTMLTISSIEELQFGDDPDFNYLTLMGSQIGPAGVSSNLHVIGSAGPDEIDIFLGSGESIDLSLWTFTGWTPIVTQVGDPAADYIYIIGAGGAETIVGSSQSDTIFARSGNDNVSGGDGSDNLRGEAGDDTLNGGAGDDLMRGSAGVDTFIGGDGFDRVSFYDNNATQGAVASLMTQTITNDGHGNAETMSSIEGLGGGTAFADFFEGDNNANMILGGIGDTILGQGGDDEFQMDGAAATLNGGDGNDTILSFTSTAMIPDNNANGLAEIINAPAGVTVDLGAGQVMDAYGNIGSIVSVENVGGSALDDTLIGSAEANEINGFTGNDYIDGSGGLDIIDGGEGDDTIAVTDTEIVIGESIDGGDGYDTIVAYGDVDFTLMGITSIEAIQFGGESLYNYLTMSRSQIGDGFSTTLAITGSAAADEIDIIVAPGETLDLSGWTFTDWTPILTQVGDPDADYIYIYSTGGNETIIASSQSDTVFAGSGNDNVNGGDGSDNLRGQAGDDTLNGGAGDDLMRGSAGVDTFIGGDGDDRVSFYDTNATQGVVASLMTQTISNDGFGNAETMSSIEGLGGGTAFADYFEGNNQNNMILGSIGDTIIAHAGDDEFQLDGATLVLDGGDGNDTILSFTSGALVPDANSDGIAETVTATVGVVVDLQFGEIYDAYGNSGTITNVENVGGSALNDALIGNDVANELNGFAGNDYLYGGGGADIIDGGDGDDAIGVEGMELVSGESLSGGDGFDTLEAYGDVDFTLATLSSIEALMFGGENDYNYLSFLASQIGAGLSNTLQVIGSEAPDEIDIFMSAGETLDISGWTFTGWTPIVTQVGDPTADFVVIIGAGGAETIVASSQSDLVFAGSGNDNVSGGDGSDQLRGDAGDDTLDGGAGDDLLRGSAGVDTFIGGDGFDRVSFYDTNATQGVIASLMTQTITNDGHGNAETMSSIEGLGGGTAFADYFEGDNNANMILASIGDTVIAHDGDDEFQLDGATLTLDGGAGIDTILSFTDGALVPDTNSDGLAELILAGAGVTVNLSTGQIVDAYGNVGSITNVENVGGSALDDTLTGSSVANVLNGYDGNDTLSGLEGDDELDGDIGDDVLNGGAGNDIMRGGAGTNTASYAGASSAVTVSLLSLGVGQNTFGSGTDTLFDITNLIGSSHNDTLIGDGGGNVLDGGAGNDTLNAGGDDDILIGGDGVDTAVFSIASTDASWSRNSDGTWTVTGADGFDTLSGVEILNFTDRDVHLDQPAYSFYGDWTSDILLRRFSDGVTAIWTVQGATVTSAAVTSAQAGTEWSLEGFGDFNSDGTADFLLRRNSDQVTAIWSMDGATVADYGVTNWQAGADWTIMGVADFNSDGFDDLLWRRSDGVTAIWQMNGTTVIQADVTQWQASLDWAIAGLGDFNGDGRDDFLLRRNSDGVMAIWQMNGHEVDAAGVTSQQAGLGWQVAGVADFNGDGRDDVLLRNDSGVSAVWTMDGFNVANAAVTTQQVGLDWDFAAVGDYDGDGNADILLRNDNGLLAIWRMDGATVLSADFTTQQAGDSWGVI